MNWQHFQTYNEAPTQAFESMCNQLFELWCNKTYPNSLKSFTTVNGSGGDGGVESFAIKRDETVIGMQAKWFLNSISSGQFGQIRNSIKTALKVRPLIKKYIVCIPRDLSADRIGKGKRVTEDNELSRWLKLKNKFEEEYPGLEIELWNETQLLTKLQDSDAAGIYRYWFEKSEISKELLVYSYEKQKSGWLSQKYTPSLHIQGQIQKNILKFIGSSDERQKIIFKLNTMSQQCRKFLIACDDYLQFVNDHSSQEKLIREIQRTKKSVKNLLGELNIALETVSNDQRTNSMINEDNWYIDFVLLLQLLKKNEEFRGNYFHINEIKKAAELLLANEIHTIISDIHFQLDNKKFLILGNPGLGKTHGIANLVEKLLNSNLHIPILIRAKDINPRNNWVDILKKTLGLASVWNESELWQALEALSYRNEIKIKDTVRIIPKILICIEGVDESRPYDLWHERLREIEAICSKYPRLRFCITSRPYVFRELAFDDSLLSNTLRLPSDGDVPVNELFKDYIEHYRVNIDGLSWIKWSLKTPLALRIFCENYKNKSISGMKKSSITITSLLSQKFRILEKEFKYKLETDYGDKEFVVQSSLVAIAKNFLENKTVTRNDLINSLKDVSGLLTVRNDYRGNLIDFIEDYGILQSYTINSVSVLEPPKTCYSIGVQPFFDYILALLITNQIQDPSQLIFTDTLLDHEGALQMVSILLLEDYNYLVAKNKSFREGLNNNKLFDLVCFSLSNVSPSPTAKYKAWIKRIMNYNSNSLKSIVKKIVLPVSRIENHPLGPQMLHEHLMEYETAGSRDIMWSVPSYLRGQEDASWICYTNIDLNDRRYELNSEDKHNGLPLIYAWMLTTVNNIERVAYRKKLMKWATKQPLEFYKMFQDTYKTNDPQMKEDLFAIAMGTVFMLEKGHLCIKLFSNWMLNNIFAPEKINLYYNCAIRYYSRAIVERSYAFEEIKAEDVEKSRPPYHTFGNIPLNLKATSGTRMGGYGPIDYDLARYVLCDPIDRMFFSNRGSNPGVEVDYTSYFSEEEIQDLLTNEKNSLSEKCYAKLKDIQLKHINRRKSWDNLLNNLPRNNVDTNLELPIYKYNKEGDSFLLEHARILEMESLDAEQFVLAAAYAYILLQGWKKEEFYGYPNGDKPGEVIGVDIAIMRQHPSATHGSKSSIMTFCEKYTWCVRNEILGYLSDRLLFRDFEKAPSLLNDYGLLDDFPNPAQELFQENPDSLMGKTSWFIPEDLSPLINESLGEAALRDWIINAPNPNFEKWIGNCDINDDIIKAQKKDWISLYNFNSVSNTLGGESLMWMSSGIINSNNFKYLKNDILNRKESLVHNLLNPEDFHSSTETQCYITPKEICWMNWKDECNNTLHNVSIADGDFKEYTIEKAVEECTANYPEFGDVYYKLPSRIIREILGISNGDGYKYYNGEKELGAFFINAGEKWYDSQSYLCVDREKLLSQLHQSNLQIFWIVRLLRQATSKSLEKYPKLHSRNDKCWFVWFEDGEIKSQPFSEEVK
ncbi:hypothetical protein AB1L05_22895 [Cytobacillus horneckiae]|uniref:NACHT domain-containing protein n=1 Tax=Cytobacillus horneckiae TaxID=549687 RepID=UPI0039A14055